MRRYIIITITAFAILFMSGCEEKNHTSKIEGNIDEIDVVTSISSTRLKPMGNSVEIYWSYSEDVSSYILEYGTKEGGLDESITLSGDTLSYKVINLDEDTSYIFRLTTIFKDDTKIHSDILEAKTSTVHKIQQSDEGAGI